MKILIKRPKQYADKMRAYKIKADNTEIAVINAGDDLEISIPNGAKHLIATVDWATSNSIEVSKLSSDDVLHVKNAFSHMSWVPLISLYYSLFNRKKYLVLGTSA